MSEAMTIAILGNVILLTTTVGGWIYNYKSTRNTKRLTSLEDKVKKLNDEVRARIALEKVTAEWIENEYKQKTATAIKNMLRKATEEKTGLRPTFKPSDLIKE